MAKRVYVTSAQVDAARALVERSALSGKSVPSSVAKIAKAKSETAFHDGAFTAAHSARTVVGKSK